MSDKSRFKIWKISSKVYITPSTSPKRILKITFFLVALCCCFGTIHYCQSQGEKKIFNSRIICGQCFLMSVFLAEKTQWTHWHCCVYPFLPTTPTSPKEEKSFTSLLGIYPKEMKSLPWRYTTLFTIANT